MASAHARSAAAAHAEHARRQRELSAIEVRLSGLLSIWRSRDVLELFDMGALCSSVQDLETVQHLLRQLADDFLL